MEANEEGRTIVYKNIVQEFFIEKEIQLVLLQYFENFGRDFCSCIRNIAADSILNMNRHVLHS